MDPQMFLKAVGHYWVPVGRYAFCTACKCTFCWSPSSWFAWRILQEVPVEGFGRGWEFCPAVLLGACRFQGASYGLRGAWGMRYLLHCSLPLLLWGHQHCGGGCTMGSLWGLPWRRGSLSALHMRGRSPWWRRRWLTSFVDPSIHKVHLLACRGTHHSQLWLLESLSLQEGCIVF